MLASFAHQVFYLALLALSKCAHAELLLEFALGGERLVGHAGRGAEIVGYVELGVGGRVVAPLRRISRDVLRAAQGSGDLSLHLQRCQF